MVLKWAIFIPGVLLLIFSFLLWISDQAMIDLLNSYAERGFGITGNAQNQLQAAQQNVIMTQIGMVSGAIIIIVGLVINKEFFNRIFKIQKK